MTYSVPIIISFGQPTFRIDLPTNVITRGTQFETQYSVDFVQVREQV
jgi:hypothetical protein